MRRVVLWVVAVGALLVPAWYALRTHAEKVQGRSEGPSVLSLFSNPEVVRLEGARKDRIRSEQHVALLKCSETIARSRTALADAGLWEGEVRRAIRSSPPNCPALLNELQVAYARGKAAEATIRHNLELATLLRKEIDEASAQGSLLVPEFSRLFELELSTEAASFSSEQFRRETGILKNVRRSWRLGAESCEESIVLEDSPEATSAPQHPKPNVQ